MSKQNKQYTTESWAIANGKPGTHFYSDKQDKHLTAIATHHRRRIKTERILTVTTKGRTPHVQYITKVTLFEKIEDANS